MDQTRRVLLPLFAILSLPSVVAAQGEILQQMHNQAGAIALVGILDPEERVVITDHITRVICTARCVVKEPIKGNLKKGEQIRFQYNRSSDSLRGNGSGKKPAVVETGEDRMIFMKSTAMGEYTDESGKVTQVLDGVLIDQWMGVMYHEPALADLLKQMTEKHEQDNRASR